MEADKIATTTTGKATPAATLASETDRQALVVVVVERAGALRPAAAVRLAKFGDVLAVVHVRIGQTLQKTSIWPISRFAAVAESTE